MKAKLLKRLRKQSRNKIRVISTTTTKGVHIDHINNIKTDNRLSNLQIISISLNIRKDRKNRSSKYPWVYFDKSTNKWRFSFNASGFDIRSRRFYTESIAYAWGLDWMITNKLENFINESKLIKS